MIGTELKRTHEKNQNERRLNIANIKAKPPDGTLSARTARSRSLPFFVDDLRAPSLPRTTTRLSVSTSLLRDNTRNSDCTNRALLCGRVCVWRCRSASLTMAFSGRISRRGIQEKWLASLARSTGLDITHPNEWSGVVALFFRSQHGLVYHSSQPIVRRGVSLLSLAAVCVALRSVRGGGDDFRGNGPAPIKIALRLGLKEVLRPEMYLPPDVASAPSVAAAETSASHEATTSTTRHGRWELELQELGIFGSKSISDPQTFKNRYEVSTVVFQYSEGLARSTVAQ